MNSFLPTLGALVIGAAASVSAQNGEISVLHGVPGLAGPVDVVANGTTLLSGVTFGTAQSLSVAPGTYNIDIVQAGTVLLSGSATVASGESYTAAAHLQVGGAPIFSVVQNDLSAVAVQGSGRLALRCLADSQVMVVEATSPTLRAISFIGNTQPVVTAPLEVDAGTYDVRGADASGGQFPLPLPATAPGTGSQVIAADECLTVSFVGVPGTPSFTTITERFSLTPASIITPSACDVTVAGTLVGGSLANGGTLDLSLTNAGPNDLCALFLAADNTPSTVFNINLGIGATGIVPIAFGLADAMGDFSESQNYPPIGTLPGLPPIVLDWWLQGVSLRAAPGSFNFAASCISDIEFFQVSLR